MGEEKKNPETLGGLCSRMLSSPMPASEDLREALLELKVKPTCAATIVYGMIQKAAKGDTSAAKFIKELNGEGASANESGVTDLRNVSDNAVILVNESVEDHSYSNLVVRHGFC